MNIAWSDLIGPLVIFAVALAATLLLGWRARRKMLRAEEKQERESRTRTVRVAELQTFLLNKIVEDLREANSSTTPLLRALREIVDTADPRESDLKHIAQIFRYRRGFKNEWIGE